MTSKHKLCSQCKHECKQESFVKIIKCDFQSKKEKKDKSGKE